MSKLLKMDRHIFHTTLFFSLFLPTSLVAEKIKRFFMTHYVLHPRLRVRHGTSLEHMPS